MHFEKLIKEMNLLEDTKQSILQLNSDEESKVKDARLDIIATTSLIAYKKDKEEAKAFFNILLPLLTHPEHELAEECFLTFFLQYTLFDTNSEDNSRVIEEIIPLKYMEYLLNKNEEGEERYKNIGERSTICNTSLKDIGLCARENRLISNYEIGNKFLESVSSFYTNNLVNNK